MHPIVDLLRPYDDPAYLVEQRRVDTKSTCMEGREDAH